MGCTNKGDFVLDDNYCDQKIDDTTL